jgi:carbamoyltransferase
MQLILGINSFHADSSACIIKDDKLLFAIEEEKINRNKHWSGFPAKSILIGLKQCKINPNQLTDVAISVDPKSNLFSKVSYFSKNYIFGEKKFEIFNRLKKRIGIKQELLKIGIKNAKIHFIEHHLSHIASAFYASGFEKAVGLSLDGFGDFTSLAIAECNHEEIKIKKRVFFPHSLGVFYEASTQFLGFSNYGDEYKVMGLSGYGKPTYFEKMLENLFEKDKNFYKLNLKYFNHVKNDFQYNFEESPKQNEIYSNGVEEILKLKKNNNKNNLSNDYLNFAASTQKVFEFYLKKIILYIKNNYAQDCLVYAGGCALNSKANQILYKNKYFKNIFIPYAPGDGGGCLGAAFVVNKKKNLNQLKNPYIGQYFDYSTIEHEINKLDKLLYKVKYYDHENSLLQHISKKLSYEKVIGWYQNKIEFGARALGNRSIIADPSNPNIKDLINKKIKKRESFRPFAPVVLHEEKNNWFESDKENLFMSSVEDVKDDKKKIIPGVVHVDGTARVQSITYDQNPKFYKLIKSFFKLKGIPMLLNTSFNENEPIVNTPQEAINCFLRTKMDILVIENFVIERVSNDFNS